MPSVRSPSAVQQPLCLVYAAYFINEGGNDCLPRWWSDGRHRRDGRHRSSFDTFVKTRDEDESDEAFNWSDTAMKARVWTKLRSL